MENRVMVPVSNALFTKEGFETRKALASTLAGSTIIPKNFQKSPANVLIALNMAERLNADPMMVMQNLYIVNGNPGWSSKFLIATFNTCGRFSPIRYEFFGKPGNDDYGCRAYATELSTGERVQSVDVTMGMAKAEGWLEKNGSKWKTMPQLMMSYRAAAFLIRTVAPEISMGLQTSEELVETIDLTEGEKGSYTFDDVAGKVEAETQRAMENLADSEQSMASPNPQPDPAPAEAPAEQPKKRPF